jgi:pimeloyl-ACP methyl ester carboxylesterase
MTMKTAIKTVDGLKIRFAEGGQPHAEAVVLTNPWPESLYAFRKIWDRLIDRFHVVAIDLPGFGGSERRLDLLSPRAMASFLVTAVQEWNLGPTHFISPDVGTSAALFVAANRPDLTRSLVVGNGGAAYPLQVTGTLKNVVEAPDLEGYRRLDSRDILGPVFDAIPGEPLPDDVRADYLDSYAGDRFVESARYVRTYPAELRVLAQRLGAIKTPVQILASRKDPLVPPANAEFLRDRLPHSRLLFLDAGHFAWEEVSDQYGTAVLEWLQQGHRETASAPPTLYKADRSI